MARRVLMEFRNQPRSRNGERANTGFPLLDSAGYGKGAARLESKKLQDCRWPLLDEITGRDSTSSGQGHKSRTWPETHFPRPAYGGRPPPPPLSSFAH